MNMFIVSVLLAAVYLTGCSSHRPTSRGRTSFVTRAQIGRICNEIVTLREEIGNQQKEIGQIVTLKEEISQLQQQNTELQNRIEDLEQSSTGAGPQSAVQSAFAIFDENPIEAESTVGSNVMTVPTSGVWTNIGDDFNVTTGEYTAPIDGTYVFILNVYNKENLMHHTHCYIRRNNEYVAIAYAEYIDDTANDHHSGTAATVLSLKQGDIVYAGECSKVDDLYSFTSFMGFLLAVDPSEEEK